MEQKNICGPVKKIELTNDEWTAMGNRVRNWTY